MTYPRLHTVDPQTPGFFHCISRCVRRASLCGEDAYSGRSYEHRKAWVEERLLALAECFAVGLYAYAVMSNHVHVVLHVDPQVAQTWPDEEVAERWVRLFPVRVDGTIDERLCEEKVRRLQGDPERMAELRSRLGSLSWFMRCLNEPIARQANREDGCTGRFWEGRFKSQALLDERAVLSCMVYVDLNPIRAGIARDLIVSEHTSIRRRFQRAEATTTSWKARLRPVAGMLLAPALSLRTVDYVELVDWSGRVAREGEVRCDRGGSTPHTDPTGFAGAAVACPDAGYREPLWAGGGHGGVLDDQGKGARAALAERGGRGAASCIGVRPGKWPSIRGWK